MKGIVKCVLAVALVLASALPAMARSWDVCIDPATDINLPFEFLVPGNGTTVPPSSPVQQFFSAVAFFYPAGTFTSDRLQTCHTNATQLGRFFAKGAVVFNLPDDNGVHDFFADWYFQFNAKG